MKPCLRPAERDGMGHRPDIESGATAVIIGCPLMLCLQVPSKAIDFTRAWTLTKHSTLQLSISMSIDDILLEELEARFG
jgi:hypothetical protein